MATQKPTLNFTKPIATRDGNDVRFYDIFDGRYINGAYYEPEDDVWYPCQWGINGVFGARDSGLDLINVSEYKQDGK